MDTAQILVEQLKQIGVNAKIQLVEWDSWLSDVYTDRKFQSTVLDMIADGKETIIGSSMFPAFEKYYMPELADKYSQDTAKAKELLAEVGFPDGFDMTITVPSNYQ